MEVTITLPSAWADAVRWELQRRGYAGTDKQVRFVFRYVVRETMQQHWWVKKGHGLWWRGEPSRPARQPEPWPVEEVGGST